MPLFQTLVPDQPLTDFAISYGQSMNTFIADRAATAVRVDEEAGKFRVWSKADWFRTEMELRQDKSKVGLADPTLSWVTYQTLPYGLGTMLSDRERDKARSVMDLEQDKVRWLVEQAKRKRDKLFAAAAFATGLWTSVTEQTGKAAAPGANEFLQFNDESSVPLQIFDEQTEAVFTASGLRPNIAVMNSKAELALRRHPDIVARFQYTTGGVVTNEQLAQVLRLEEVIVGDASENTAAKNATASMSRIFGNHILLCYRARTKSTTEPTAVSMIAWSPHDNVDANGAAVYRWRDDSLRSDVLEVEQYVVPQITANDLGVFLKDAVA